MSVKMPAKFVLITLVAGVLALGLACGGGGGADGSSSSTGIRFSGKDGDGLKVYGLDGTYSSPSPLYFSGNFIASGVDNTGTLDVELEKGNYRIRYVDNGLELMEFVVLESDFPAEGSTDRTVNMGEMNGVTTYLSSLFFKEVSLEKPRAKAAEVLSALEAFFEARGMTSFQNATRGSIETYLRTAEERTWANLTMINLRRVANELAAGNAVTQATWDGLVDTITDMAVLDGDGGDPTTLSSTYLGFADGLPELSESEAEEIIIGLSTSGNQFANLLDMAQAADATAFSYFQTQYVEDKVADGIYAFVDLSTGAVTYADELTLDATHKDSVMVFSKVPASSDYPFFIDGVDNSISLGEYYVGVYEVTESQYGQLVSGEFSGDTPVHSVTHNHALSYATTLGGRLLTGAVNLPTDAQWEIAARGAGATTSDSDTTAYTTWNCFDNGGFTSESVAVGSLENANVYGLYDMNGNVAEYCLDRLTSITGSSDPVGDTSVVSVRGGGWLNVKEHCAVGHKEVTYNTDTEQQEQTANAVTGFRLIFTKN
jgi:hypothetical protein